MIMLRREMGMASNPEFVQYVCDQMRGAGNITYKKMFDLLQRKNHRIGM